MPNSKPTARVFTQDGLALGYLKLGWSEATDELVENETQTLVSLDGRVGPVTTPTVAASGGWSGHRFHLARSLPAGVRPWSGESGHPTAIRAVASTGWVRSVPLAGSEYAEGTSRATGARPGRGSRRGRAPPGLATPPLPAAGCRGRPPDGALAR